jgi:Uncharacterized protein conserved in bacteria (DUF2312)
LCRFLAISPSFKNGPQANYRDGSLQREQTTQAIISQGCNRWEKFFSSYFIEEFCRVSPTFLKGIFSARVRQMMAISKDIRGVYAEMNGCGFDVRAVRQIVPVALSRCSDIPLI